MTIYFLGEVDVPFYENKDLTSIVTPLNVVCFSELLIETGYDEKETEFLVSGFTNGFDIGYRGPSTRRSESANIPFMVGDKWELWAKIMAEMKEG